MLEGEEVLKDLELGPRRLMDAGIATRPEKCMWQCARKNCCVADTKMLVWAMDEKKAALDTSTSDSFAGPLYKACWVQEAREMFDAMLQRGTVSFCFEF